MISPIIAATIWPLAASTAALSPPETNHLIPPISIKINAAITAMKKITLTANLTTSLIAGVGIDAGGVIPTWPCANADPANITARVESANKSFDNFIFLIY